METVLTMGIMEDVSIFPQPAGGKSLLVSSKQVTVSFVASKQVAFVKYF